MGTGKKVSQNYLLKMFSLSCRNFGALFKYTEYLRVESNFWETGVNVREARWCFEAVDPEFASETTDQDLRHSALIQNQDDVKIFLATEKAS